MARKMRKPTGQPTDQPDNRPHHNAKSQNLKPIIFRSIDSAQWLSLKRKGFVIALDLETGSLADDSGLRSKQTSSFQFWFEGVSENQDNTSIMVVAFYAPLSGTRTLTEEN